MEKIVLMVLFYEFSRFLVRKGKLANLSPFPPPDFSIWSSLFYAKDSQIWFQNNCTLKICTVEILTDCYF